MEFVQNVGWIILGIIILGAGLSISDMFTGTVDKAYSKSKQKKEGN